MEREITPAKKKNESEISEDFKNKRVREKKIRIDKFTKNHRFYLIKESL